MSYPTLSLWVGEFSGEKFSRQNKNSHIERKILTTKKNSRSKLKVFTAKDKFSQQNENSRSKIEALTKKNSYRERQISQENKNSHGKRNILAGKKIEKQ